MHKREIQKHILLLLVNSRRAGTSGVTIPWNTHFFYHFFMGLSFTDTIESVEDQ
jgi:hypothetical protein